MTISQSFPRIPKPVEPVEKRQRTENDNKKPKKKKLETNAYHPTRASQIDPDVLDEIPEHMKTEILEYLKPAVKNPPVQQQWRCQVVYEDDSHEIEVFKQFNDSSDTFTAFFGYIKTISHPNLEQWQQLKSDITEMIHNMNLEDAQKSLALVVQYPFYFFSPIFNLTILSPLTTSEHQAKTKTGIQERSTILLIASSNSYCNDTEAF